MFKKYTDLLNEIKSLQISKKKKLASFFIGLGIAIFICSGPICLFANLFIFEEIQKLMAFAIATMLIFVIGITYYIYYKGITDGKVNNIRTIYLTDTFIMAIVIYCILIIFYFLGVV